MVVMIFIVIRLVMMVVLMVMLIMMVNTMMAAKYRLYNCLRDNIDNLVFMKMQMSMIMMVVVMNYI